MRKPWGVPGIAICFRRAEYLTLPTRLRLNAAISVDALSKNQIQAIHQAVDASSAESP